MTIREKLIELLGDCTCSGSCGKCEYEENLDGCINHLKESMADHLIANGVILIPSHGSTLEVSFNPGDLYGTLKLENDTCQVYLGRIEHHQIGRSIEYFGHKRNMTQSLIKRVFTIIER